MSKSASAQQKILVVLHQESSSSGKLGQMLRAKGFALDVRKPRFGDPLPETLEGHAGAIIFGGPMSANDNEDYLKRETDWIGLSLKEGAPFLGVCLGAQMLEAPGRNGFSASARPCRNRLLQAARDT